MRILLRFWLPLVVHMGLIFFLSSRTHFPVEMPPWAYHVDKCVHAFLFGFLAFLFLRALLKGNYPRVSFKTAIASIAFTVFYGATDEFHQQFVPGRTPDPYDIAADAAGAIIVCLFILFLNSYRKK